MFILWNSSVFLQSFDLSTKCFLWKIFCVFTSI